MSTTAWDSACKPRFTPGLIRYFVSWGVLGREGVDLMAGWVGCAFSDNYTEQARRSVAFVAVTDDDDDCDATGKVEMTKYDYCLLENIYILKCLVRYDT